MLTRTQVAERLGKSIATVRRMEGTELHPQRDSAGVHRFDPAEIEQVARFPQKRFAKAVALGLGETPEREQALEDLLAESENTVRRLERELEDAQQLLVLDRTAAAEEAIHLREALDLSLCCIAEQLGARTPPEIVALLESLIVGYSTWTPRTEACVERIRQR